MNHDAHTLREFDAALSSLNTYLLQMAYKAQSALDLAVASLLQQNESSANRVIADDEELDELEMTVDREGLHLLAFSVRWLPTSRWCWLPCACPPCMNGLVMRP